MSPVRPYLKALCALLTAVTVQMPLTAAAGPVLERVRTGGTLRVCIWPEYYGITLRNPRNGQLTGLDVDLAGEFARALGVRLEFVDSTFPRLVDNLVQDRCDVAMHAVGVTPERQKHLQFSIPYLRSGIYGITTKGNRMVRTWDDIDQPGVRVAVTAGTFMEPVMARALRKAELVVLPTAQSREQELLAGRVDAFMTDYPYSRRLTDSADWVRLLAPREPFHPMPYAYAVKPGDAEWLQTVNQFVRDIQADGRLGQAARRHGLTEIVVKP